MTGGEALEVTMMQLGATKQQIKNQTVNLVLEAMAKENPDTKEIYKEIIEEKKRELLAEQNKAMREYSEYRSQRTSYYQAQRRYEEKEVNLRAELCKEIDRRESEISEREKEVARKEELYKNIETCETDEAKDKLRLAEYFKKSVAEFEGNKDYIVRLMAGLSNILGATRTEKPKTEE